jgi:hypothetical protein
MEFDQVIKGIIKYVRAVMFPTLTPAQKLVAQTAIIRLERSSTIAKKKLVNNFFAKTLQIVTEEEQLDIEGLMRDLKEAFVTIGAVPIELPLLGKYTFNTGDVDVLHKYIREA